MKIKKCPSRCYEHLWTLEPNTEDSSMNIYRKIYETFHGAIPKDQDGITYDIHHINGDRKNNNIFNNNTILFIHLPSLLHLPFLQEHQQQVRDQEDQSKLSVRVLQDLLLSRQDRLAEVAPKQRVMRR